MAQSCIETRPQIACFTPVATGIPQSVLVHVIYEGGKPIGQAITTADDTETPVVPDYVAGDTLTAGACPIAAPDVEWEILCDKQADGTVVKFACRVITTFDAVGAVASTTVDNFELDKVTAYVPTGTVGNCLEDCPVVGSLGNVTDWASF